MFLSKFQNVFVQIAKCTYPNAKHLCPNGKMCLSKNRQSEQHVWNKPTVFSLIRESFLISSSLHLGHGKTNLAPYKLIREGLKVYHIQKREIYLDFGCNILSIVALVKMCKHCFSSSSFCSVDSITPKQVSSDFLHEIIHREKLEDQTWFWLWHCLADI